VKISDGAREAAQEINRRQLNRDHVFRNRKGEVAPVMTEDELTEIIQAAIDEAVKETTALVRERCAKVADKWAQSASCDSHDTNPCCHVRTGAGIAEAIRTADLSKIEGVSRG
jgi:hypothetical protein